MDEILHLCMDDQEHPIRVRLVACCNFPKPDFQKKIIWPKFAQVGGFWSIIRIQIIFQINFSDLLYYDRQAL